MAFEIGARRLTWRSGHEVVVIDTWGPSSVRVQAGFDAIHADTVGALNERPDDHDPEITLEGDGAVLRHDDLTVAISASGEISFSRQSDGHQLLREQDPHFWWPRARNMSDGRNGYYRIEQNFAAHDGEKFFGFGQHMDERFDRKGDIIDLVQRNGAVTIPFTISSRGYGFLWNSPAIGRVELAFNATRWIADSARQIDYWITTGDTPRELLAHYACATGHTPALPKWASGFWQSKLRYKTQAELLEVAHEYDRRNLPLAVIVVDYFHSEHQGDWSFQNGAWPDPTAMVDELESLGVKLMVSVWPMVSPLSVNFEAMRELGLLIATYNGVDFVSEWPDTGDDASIPVAFYDATNAEARSYLWKQLSNNYASHGIHSFWLDADEPELLPSDPSNLRLYAGPGNEVANIYPHAHAMGVAQGMEADQIDGGLLLTRSAWAGSQSLPAVLWSGDIPSTFESLSGSVRAALNVSLSGIHWWTTDIGGFHGGDPSDPDFQELLIRWFQFGAYCPIFRLHGWRSPGQTKRGMGIDGAPNEVWSYGQEALTAITTVMKRRESLRPYIHQHLEAGRADGVPLLRALLVEFPEDRTAWTIDDQFMFGPDLLVAPVLSAGARRRRVYLPAGTAWRDTNTGQVYAPGSWIDVDAPLHEIPTFVRDDRPDPSLSVQTELVPIPAPAE